jgi:hypothetical protein
MKDQYSDRERLLLRLALYTSMQNPTLGQHTVRICGQRFGVRDFDPIDIEVLQHDEAGRLARKIEAMLMAAKRHRDTA